MPTNKEIEKQYAELRKKYRLPEFRKIDLEFEISDLEETNFLLRAVMRKIAEKIEFYTTVIGDMLQPDASNIYSMHENRVFDDEEKKNIFEFYKRLMILNRHALELSLGNSEREEANFINDFINEWAKIKSELALYIRKMKDSWKTDSNIEEDVEYLG